MPHTQTLLLTGFGPFPGVPVNASGELVARLGPAARKAHPGLKVHTTTLPTVWLLGPDHARAAIERIRPDIVIHFGVSAQATGFVIERAGTNACAAIADAGGELPRLAVLDINGPDQRCTTLPVGAIVLALTARGLPATTSEDAGKYLCNAVLYRSLGLADGPAMTGFVHIPASLGAGSLTLYQALSGGLAIIATCLDKGPGA